MATDTWCLLSQPMLCKEPASGQRTGQGREHIDVLKCGMRYRLIVEGVLWSLRQASLARPLDLQVGIRNSISMLANWPPLYHTSVIVCTGRVAQIKSKQNTMKT